MDQETISLLRHIVGALMISADTGELSSDKVFLFNKLCTKLDEILSDITGETWTPMKYAEHGLSCLLTLAESETNMTEEALQQMRISLDEVSTEIAIKDTSEGQTVKDVFDHAYEREWEIEKLLETVMNMDDDECQSTPSQPDLLL